MLLKSQNLILRTPEPKDVGFILECENNPENWRVSQTLLPFSEEIIRKYVESTHDLIAERQVRFIIDVDSTPIGTLDLFEYDPLNERVGLGILVSKNFRGNGYASESLQTILKYCFTHLCLKNVYCNILDSNDVSKKLFQTCGFEHSGTKQDWVKQVGGFEDEHFYQLTSKKYHGEDS